MDYSNQSIIKKFSDYFEKKGHVLYPPSSLLSENDNTVLFTTAGMQQFKEYYLDPDKAKDKNIITIQPCIRTSDIDEVGDKTHLSSFVMLGNFSFGGYSKKEAIDFAWEFLTGIDFLAVDKKRISATYFSGEKAKDLEEDVESKTILENLKKDGLNKVIAQNFKENFWSLGSENSPAGPTVEFYVDEIEVWNIVFNQYKIVNNKYEEVDNLGIDTGLGVERLEMVLNKSDNVFNSDYYLKDRNKLDKEQFSQKEIGILLDHLRTIRYLLKENLEPSNKDQGYILRRLIRRVIVILNSKKQSISQFIDNDILKGEENNFIKVISNGRNKLIQKYKSKKEISAQDLFDLYQSYGLPLEISQEILSDQNIKLNDNTVIEFQKLYNQHQNISRSSSGKKFSGGLVEKNVETIKLHTATHLLLSALKKNISHEIVQKGSNITSERLRFDFNYDNNLTESEIKKIEDNVNDWIKKELSVESKNVSIEKAKELKAEGQFMDRYNDDVLVYTIKDGKIVVSCEICGGPHVKNTKELGIFKVIKSESVAKGVKRIKAKLI